MPRLFFLITILLIISTTSVQAQRFPSTWEGTWEGTLTIYNQGKVGYKVDMSLTILPMDSSDRWQWTLSYLAEGQEPRMYELVPIDTAKGHYQIDEKNSILLDSYLFGNTFSSRFEVDSSLLLTSYTYFPELDKLRFDINWGKMNKTETGAEVGNTIFAFPLTVHHEAWLTRKEE